MVVIATGINGASAQFLVMEDRRLATGHVITRNHSMAEKVAQLSDPQLKQRNAVPVNVPVSKCKKRKQISFSSEKRKNSHELVVKCSYVEIELQSSNFATTDTCEERGFTSRYTLCFGAVELFRTNILVNFISVILICLFQSSGRVCQNWKKDKLCSGGS